MYSGGVHANRLNARGSGVVSSSSGWNHVTVTYDGSGSPLGLNLYYNNVLQVDDYSGDNAWESGTYVSMKQTTQDVLIGNEEGDSSSYNVDFEEFIIYKNRVLTVAEISYLYNSGSGINLE